MSFRHFSWNSIGGDCKYQLYKRYIEGHETQTKAHMIRGLMQEAGPTSIIRGYISGVTASDPESAIKRVWEDNFSILSPDEADHLKGMIPKMTDLSKKSVDDILDLGIKPETVQKKYQFKIKDISLPIIGFSDLTGEWEGRTVILDWKSGDKAPGSSKLNVWKQQLGCYALAEMAEADSTVLPILINQHFKIMKTKQVVEFFHHDTTAEDLSTVLLKANELQRCVDLDHWPRNRNSNLCSERFCDFYSECHFETLIPVSSIRDQINPI